MLAGMGEVDEKVLARFQEQHGGSHLQLRLHPSARKGPPQVTVTSALPENELASSPDMVSKGPGSIASADFDMLPLQERINDTPMYANVKWVVNKDGTPAAIEINYLTFYAHNGHYDVGYIGLFKVKPRPARQNSISSKPALCTFWRLSFKYGNLLGRFKGSHPEKNS